MKQCPLCSTRNPNDSKFCKGCGASLEGVEAISDGTNELIGKANIFLKDSAKKAKKATEAGIEKAKQVAMSGKEKLNDMSHSSTSVPPAQTESSWDSAAQNDPQQNSDWNRPVNQSKITTITIERYPFFQSEEEKTIAVIGEQFAATDLEGTYQAPYAVLTQEKLYCRNETGHFIKDISQIETLQIEHQAKKYFVIGNILVDMALLMWFFMQSILSGLIMVVGLALIWYFTGRLGKRKYVKVRSANIKMCVVWSFICAIVIFFFYNKLAGMFALLVGLLGTKYLQQYIKSPEIFSVSCSGGTFSFMVSNYPQQEISNFIEKALPFCGGGKPSSYQAGTPSRNNKSGKGAIIAVSILAVLAVVAFGFWYFENHCKVFGCDQEPFRDGYCTYHYGKNKLDNAYSDVENFFGGLFED